MFLNEFSLNFPDSASMVAKHLVMFHDFTLLVLTLILAFVCVILFLMMKKGFIFKQLTAHHQLEFVWTVLPIILLVFIAVPSLTLLFMSEDSSEAFSGAKAMGYQWYWSYESYELPLTESAMVPVSESHPSLFRLLDTTYSLKVLNQVPFRVMVSSKDVLHSWTVPTLGVKVDACPGRLNEVILFPNRPGTFYGQCSEICGTNHSFMPIELKVLLN